MFLKHFKKGKIFVVGFVCPFVILASSIASLRYERDSYVAVHTRDSAQVMYCFITFLGLFGVNTKITYLRQRISLDLITVGILGVCCMIMSLSTAQNISGKTITMLDITASSAAFVFLLTVTMDYIKKL